MKLIVSTGIYQLLDNEILAQGLFFERVHDSLFHSMAYVCLEFQQLMFYRSLLHPGHPNLCHSLQSGPKMYKQC